MQGQRILVVEDEPVSRAMLKRMLASRGFDVHTVTDAAECMARLSEQTPDIVLLDVGMPGMSGLDLLKCIRRGLGQDQLPVILVTAMDDAEDIIAGLEAGANDYVVKPVNLPVLLARMGVALRMKKSVDRLVRAEGHRVMLESLDGACRTLAEPMAAIVRHLEQLIQDQPDGASDMRTKLEETLAWAQEVGELIGRFQRIADYQTVPYTDGVDSFVTASLESAESTKRERNKRESSKRDR